MITYSDHSVFIDMKQRATVVCCSPEMQLTRALVTPTGLPDSILICPSYEVLLRPDGEPIDDHVNDRYVNALKALLHEEIVILVEQDVHVMARLTNSGIRWFSLFWSSELPTRRTRMVDPALFDLVQDKSFNALEVVLPPSVLGPGRVVVPDRAGLADVLPLVVQESRNLLCLDDGSWSVRDAAAVVAAFSRSSPGSRPLSTPSGDSSVFQASPIPPGDPCDMRSGA